MGADESRGPAVLPEEVERGGLRIRRWLPTDAAVMNELIAANVDHLRPFMAWASEEPLAELERVEFLLAREQEWLLGGGVHMGIWLNGVVVGSTGLHRRLGPEGLEIGYWVDSRHLGRGIATRTARALTDLAFTVPGIEVVQIGHDLANVASARVPEKLGYRRLLDRPSHAPSGTSGTGQEGVWVTTRAEWIHARLSGQTGSTS